MANPPSRKAKAYIQMRADPHLKSRFDAACEYKGWKIQTALEKIVERWLNDVELERREAKNVRSPSRPS